MSNTMTVNTTSTTAKPVADTTYEFMSVIERISFWSIVFTTGYIGYYVFFKTVLDLLGIFFTTV